MLSFLRNAQSALRQWCDSVPLPVLVMFLCVAFAQNFPATAYSALLHDVGMSPAVVSSYYATIFIPWQCKPLFAMFSDMFPVRGSRRRPYAILGLLISGITTLCTALFAQTPSELFLCGVLVSIGNAFSTMMFDAYIVEWIRGDHHREVEIGVAHNVKRASSAPLSVALLPNHGGGDELDNDTSPRTYKAEIETIECRAANVQVGSYAFQTTGDFAAKAIGIPLYRAQHNSRFIIGGSSAVVLTAIVACAWVHETIAVKVNGSTLKQRVLLFVTDLRQYGLGMLPPLVFLFVLNAAPDGADTYGQYVYSEYEKDDYIVNIIGLTGSAAALLGTLTVLPLTRRLPLRVVLATSIIVNSVCSLTRVFVPLGWTGELSRTTMFCFTSSITMFAARLRLVPMVILVTLNCPKGWEASAFAVFFAVVDGGDSVAGYISGAMTKALHISYGKWDHLPWLIVACAAANVVPLLLLPLATVHCKSTARTTKTTTNPRSRASEMSIAGADLKQSMFTDVQRNTASTEGESV